MSLKSRSRVVLPPSPYYQAGVLEAFDDREEALVSLDVVRATTATRVNENGLIESVAANVPRIDYLNGGCGELLVEEQRTNLALYSNTFDNTASGGTWSNDELTVSSDSASSPIFGENADLLTENSDVGQVHRAIQSSISISNGATYTYSIYAKANGRNFIILRSGITGSNVNNSFDISSGSVVSSGAGFTCSIENAGDGWYRIIATATSAVTSTEVQVVLSYNGSNLLYNGDGVSGVYLIGAQLEEGSYATSYIPTVASTVTRNADVISLSSASALLGDSAGGILFEGSSPSTDPLDVTISDGTISNRVILRITSNYSVVVSVGSVVQAYASGGTNTPNESDKVALLYAENSFSIWLNGVKVANDDTGTTYADGTLTDITFSSPAGTNIFYGRIRQLVVFDEALTDAELAAITS